MFTIIYNLLYPLIMIATFNVILSNINIKALNIKSMLIFSVASYIEYFMLHISKHDELIIIAITINILVWMYLVYDNIKYSIVITAISEFIFMLSDAIVGGVVIYSFNLDYASLINNQKNYFGIAVLILFSSYGISKAVRILINKAQIQHYSLNEFIKGRLMVIISTIVGLIIIYINAIAYRNLHKDLSDNAVFTYVMSIIVFFIILIILIITNNRSITKKLKQQHFYEEHRQLEEYTKILESMLGDMRKFKHDYRNILCCLEGYICDEDMEGLKEFYKSELLPEGNKIIRDDKSLIILQHIKINALKGLISSKIIDAQSKGIDTSIEILEDVEAICMSTIDICRIMGILLDNAIEEQVNCEIKKISVAVVKNDNGVVIVVSNSCSPNTPPVFKLYEKEFSTKGQNRGMGLKIVRSIVSEKYSNVLVDTKIGEGTFIQKLVIQNKK